MTTISKVAAVLGVIAGLGVAALPISTFAAAEDVTVSITISSTLGSDDAVCDTTSSSGAAGEQVDASCSVNNSSNNGLSITIQDKDANLNLVSGGNNIAPIAAVEAAAGALTQNGWGYKFENLGGTATASVQTGFNKYNPIKASGSPDTVVIATGAGTVTGNFMFSALTAASQTPGTYTDVVTVTTTAN